MKRIVILIATIGLALGIAGGAQATNIVFNGSFETGNFSNWTQTGNTGFSGVQCPGGAPDGSCSAFFGPVGSVGGISQLLSTVAGTSYLIQFSFSADGSIPSSFLATFGGTTLFSLNNPPASGFHTLTATVTATGSSTLLGFNFRDDPGFLLLDAVSVTSVPEPASLALLAIALCGMGLARRRKT